jgi:hypothetical protein
MLPDARAWGRDVDLALQAVGEDRYGCETMVRLLEAVREVRVGFGGTYPDLPLVRQR